MIYLLRHGIDDESFIGGWSDVSLTNEGIIQVSKARDFICESDFDIRKIYSSDIERARQTANIVNERLHKEIEYTPILRELNKGIYNGRKKSSIPLNEQMYTHDLDIDVIYPNGESMRMFYERIKQDLDKILSLDNSLLVTHRGVINMLYFLLRDIELNKDKSMFNVTHASLHSLDPIRKTIKRIY